MIPDFKHINPSTIELGFGSILTVTHLPVEFSNPQDPLASRGRFFQLAEQDIVYYRGLSKGQVSSDPTLGIAFVTCSTKNEAVELFEEAVDKLKKSPPVGLATTQNGRIEYRPFKGIGEDGLRLVAILYQYPGS